MKGEYYSPFCISLPMIKIKRVYKKPEKDDGQRILVDRLWPRGISKNQAKIDIWLKEIGPSNNLRKWFGHDPKRWAEFQKRYRAELHKKTDLLDEIVKQSKKGLVTLVYGAKDETHNQAVVLKDYLEQI